MPSRLAYLIDYLLKENPELEISLPENEEEQKKLLRSLMNVRPPAPISAEFLKEQDAYLQEQRRESVSLSELSPVEPGLYLWRGDITRLKVDAIVNAANSAMLGCFIPCHNCIDNVIHSAAGVQLRLECNQIMAGSELPTGGAKITRAYNLPSAYVIHTVGPIIHIEVSEKQREQLADCYRSCLELATARKLRSLAFCCISTGVFNFPPQEAASIAVRTVRDYREHVNDSIDVVFNVFKDSDYAIYSKLLGQH